MPRPFVIGVTGNIACGKSSVSRLLGEFGATVIDADRVYIGGAPIPGADTAFAVQYGITCDFSLLFGHQHAERGFGKDLAEGLEVIGKTLRPDLIGEIDAEQAFNLRQVARGGAAENKSKILGTV